jgi:hypothetical protein
MALHSPQVHGFFSIPVDHLHARNELAGHFRQYDLSNAVVVSPDLGGAKDAAAFARLLGTPVAAGAKQRFPDDKVVISSIIGDVAGKDVIVLDDEQGQHDDRNGPTLARVRYSLHTACLYTWSLFERRAGASICIGGCRRDHLY